MPVRKADAVWEGDLKAGKGHMSFGNGAYDGAYSFSSRFENGKGTNPEELIGAAHAGCFSMALSGALSRAGHVPTRISTRANVHLDPQEGGGFAVTRIVLQTKVEVAGIEKSAFDEQVEGARKNCPISRLLTGADIEVEAELIQ